MGLSSGGSIFNPNLRTKSNEEDQIMKKLTTIMMAMVLVLALATGAAAATIQTVGSAEVRVTPDTAVLSMGVSQVSSDVQQAQSEVNERIEAVRQALVDEGVSREDIASESIYMYTNYDYSEGIERIIGYNVSQQLSITVRDPDKVGVLIDATLSAGANQLNGVSFAHQDNSQAYQRALKLAVENAAQHAEAMADAAGLTLGDLTGLTESSNSYEAPFVMRSSVMEDAAAGTSVDIGSLFVQATVTATYDAK